jgi:hypothetical protein
MSIVWIHFNCFVIGFACGVGCCMWIDTRRELKDAERRKSNDTEAKP